MRYLMPIALAIVFAVGGNASIYCYAKRERPPEWRCGFGDFFERPKREASARFESDALHAAAFVVNATALVSICATLVRRRRDLERSDAD